MDSVVESILIKANKARVFDAFVNNVNDWWPFQGKHTYSFAPEATKPKHIQFEPQLGGRFFETFANGDQYQIGEIKAWQPPEQFSFTWNGEQATTLIEVRFTDAEDQTKVTLTHSGFDAAGVPDQAKGYGEGWQEILGVFAGWLEKAAG